MIQTTERHVRSTSIDTYNAIKKDGLCGALQFQIYDLLFQHGPATQGELIDRFWPGKHHIISPRFAELKHVGMIKETQKRKCKITNRTVFEWDVTSHIPNDSDFVSILKGRKNQLKETLAQNAKLRERISELERCVSKLRSGYKPKPKNVLSLDFWEKGYR